MSNQIDGYTIVTGTTLNNMQLNGVFETDESAKAYAEANPYGVKYRIEPIFSI